MESLLNDLRFHSIGHWGDRNVSPGFLCSMHRTTTQIGSGMGTRAEGVIQTPSPYWHYQSGVLLEQPFCRVSICRPVLVQYCREAGRKGNSNCPSRFKPYRSKLIRISDSYSLISASYIAVYTNFGAARRKTSTSMVPPFAPLIRL